MKILLISDVIVDHIYSSSISERLKDVDFIISCGDVPNYYLEFIVTMLNKPLFYVNGNHCTERIYSESGAKADLPEGCININQKIIEYKGLLIMGLEGSMRYNRGNFQYTESQMAWKINKLKPKLYLNKIFKKKYIDILVTHAPPYKIHDQEDLCHKGFKSFNIFIKKFKPRYLLHGHIHIYGTKNDWVAEAGNTKIINAYGYRLIEI
ncbi:MAG: metallophosphoesterase [Candidatus Humimicrobiaceae bacterium]